MLLSEALHADINYLRDIVSETEDKRKKLEEYRISFDNKLKSQSLELLGIEANFEECIFFVEKFENYRQKAEKAREELEAEWKEILQKKKRFDIRNESLEENRKNIELKYKHKKRGHNYAKEIENNYSLVNEHISEYETFIEDKYTSYYVGINNYMNIINKITEMCNPVKDQLVASTQYIDEIDNKILDKLGGMKESVNRLSD